MVLAIVGFHLVSVLLFFQVCTSIIWFIPVNIFYLYDNLYIKFACWISSELCSTLELPPAEVLL